MMIGDWIAWGFVAFGVAVILYGVWTSAAGSEKWDGFGIAVVGGGIVAAGLLTALITRLVIRITENL